MASRTLSVVIAGDASGAKRSFQETESGSESLSRKLEAVGTKMQSVGRSMSTYVTLPIVAGMALSVKAASDLDEALNKSNVIFGQNGAMIEKWAAGAASDFGLSKRAALEAAGTFGNMFDQLGFGLGPTTNMSKALTELAADLASFHNADITEVILAQQAAFRGEYDSIQRFIPTINAAAVEQQALAETGKATTAELTAQDKALAAYTLIMQGAGQAVGDFDRTSGGAANSMRTARAEIENAAASIGAVLLPIVAEAAGALADFAGWFANLPGPVKNVIVVLGVFAAAAGPVIFVTGSIIRNLETMKAGLDILGRALGTSSMALGAWGIAIGLATVAAFALSDAVQGNTGSLDVNVAAIMRLTQAQMVNAAQQIISTLGMDNFTESVRRVAEQSVTTARELVNAANLNENARRKLMDMIDREEAATARSAERSRQDADAKNRLSGAADNAARSLANLAFVQANYAVGASGGFEGYNPEGIPGFAEGGVIPGPMGSPQLVLAHGGETVFNPDQMQALASSGWGGGGNSYSISVQVAPGGNPADTGRAVVESIKAFERRAGSSWRN